MWIQKRLKYGSGMRMAIRLILSETFSDERKRRRYNGKRQIRELARLRCYRLTKPNNLRAQCRSLRLTVFRRWQSPTIRPADEQRIQSSAVMESGSRRGPLRAW